MLRIRAAMISTLFQGGAKLQLTIVAAIVALAGMTTPVVANGEAGAPGGGGAAAPPGGSLLSLIIPFGLMYLVFYFLMIRPQKKQQAQHRLLLDGLKKDDYVQTSAGFFGRVVSVESDDQVILNVDEKNNVRLRVIRSAVVAILSDEEPATASKQAAKKIEEASAGG